MNITIEIKNVYGCDKFYPACDKSKLIAQLAGTKTLTRHNLNTIKALGYTVSVAQKVVEL